MARVGAPVEPSPKTPGQQPAGSQPLGLGLVKPSIDIPSAAGIWSRLSSLGDLSPRKLIWGGVGLLVIVVFVVLVFVLRGEPSAPAASSSPTPALTVTPTQVARPFLEEAFSVFSQVNLGVGSDIFSKIVPIINQDVLAGGEPGLYKIIDPQGGRGYSFSSFMSSASVTVPEEIGPFLNDEVFYVSLMKKADGEYSYGLVVKLANGAGLAQALSRWETNISTNLKDLFGLDVSAAASVDFLDNAYQGAPIRYRNFPDPLKTIDYAVVIAANGDEYLVIVHSREHIYGIIDNLK